MHTIADTNMLVEEGVITRSAARIIEVRARNTMVALAINTLLCAGILAATFGLIFWLADAAAVAVTGVLMLAGGLLVLARGKDLYAMFGNAATLIGAGMLLGGNFLDAESLLGGCSPEGASLLELTKKTLQQQPGSGIAIIQVENQLFAQPLELSAEIAEQPHHFSRAMTVKSTRIGSAPIILWVQGRNNEPFIIKLDLAAYLLEYGDPWVPA